jgi:O-antigen/teichoic acid export membrane protein
MSISLSSLLQSSANLVTARFFSSFSRIIYAVLLAKLLGPEIYGTFQYGYSWYLLFVPLSILGMNFVIIRNLNKEGVNKHHFLTLTYSIRTWLSIFVAAVCLIFNWLLEQDTQLNLLVAVFAVTIIGRGLAGWVTAAFTGLQRPKAVLRLESIFRTLEVIVGIALLLLEFGIIWLALWHALSWFLQGWFGLRLLKKNAEFGSLRKVSLIEFSSTVKDCLPVFIAALCLMWFLQGPIVLSRYIFGLGEQLGHFALVMQAFIILSSLVSEFGNAALPLLTRQFEKEAANSQGFVGGVIIVGLGLSPLFLHILWVR